MAVARRNGAWKLSTQASVVLLHTHGSGDAIPLPWRQRARIDADMLWPYRKEQGIPRSTIPSVACQVW